MEYEQLFLREIRLIDKISAVVARRYRLPASEAEEFASVVRFKLIENDYEVLRRYRGRSSLRTYLTTVIQRICLDHRAALSGKWRPSAQARRLGPRAERLEMFLFRDGLTFDEACERLTTEEGREVDRSELANLQVRLPERPPRRFVDEKLLIGLPSRTSWSPDLLADAERRSRARTLHQLLVRLRARMAPQDRLILHLRFELGLPVVEIGRMLEMKAKPLYRRIGHLLHELRRQLEASGFPAEDVSDLIAYLDLPIDAAAASGTPLPAAELRRRASGQAGRTNRRVGADAKMSVAKCGPLVRPHATSRERTGEHRKTAVRKQRAAK